MFKATAVVVGVAVVGPMVIPAIFSGSMDGIDGYCDD